MASTKKVIIKILKEDLQQKPIAINQSTQES